MSYYLFINLSIIASFLFLAGQIFKNYPLSLSSPLRRRILLGFGGGLLGICLLIYSIKVTDNIIIDLRHLAIIGSALFGGPVSSLITSIIISIYRLILFDMSITSMIVVISILIMGALCSVISITNISQLKKYLYMNIITVMQANLTIYILLDNHDYFMDIFGYFLAIALIGGIFLYLTSQYVKTSNDTFREISYHRMVADNLTDLITTHKPNGSYIYVSPSCNGLLGYTKEELMKIEPCDLFHSLDIENIKKFNKKMLYKPTTCCIKYRIKTKDGKYIWFETTAKSIEGKDGDIKELICVSRDITLSKEYNDKLKKLSFVDGLTGISNRRHFDEYIVKEWKRGVRNSKPLSLFMIDIDDFKKYNDTYGHQKGDECLKTIAKILDKNIKRPGDLVARYGGEEFAIILPETPSNGAKIVGDRIRNEVRSLNIPNENAKYTPYVTISIGICTIIPKAELSYKELINKADKALYKAKENGKNKVELYN